MRVCQTLRLLCGLSASLGFALAQVQVESLLALDGQTSEASLSSDGKTLAFSWCKPDYSCGLYTRPFAGGEVKLLTGKDPKEGLPAYPRWSPDGKRIAFTRVYSHFDNHLFVRDLAAGVERDLGLICDGAAEGSWTPDGRFLLSSEYRTAVADSTDCRPILFSAETGKRIRRFAPRGGAFALSPNGRTLAYVDGNTLRLLPLTIDYLPLPPGKILAHEPREIVDVRWRPDGKQILYQVWGDVPYLRWISSEPGAQPRAVPDSVSDFSITQLLSDRSALATEDVRVEALWRVDLRSTPPIMETVSDLECFPGAPFCSPDGHARVLLTTRTGLAAIAVANADGTNERPLVNAIPEFGDPKDNGVPSIAGWSPDAKWIAFTVFPARGNADTRSHLYVVLASGGMPRRLGEEAFALYNPVWSRDGKALFAVQAWPFDDPMHRTRSQIVRVDVATGTITPLGAYGMWPRVSPDGGFLYFFTQMGAELRRIPINGGSSEALWSHGNLSWYSAAVGSRHLYLIQMPSGDRTDRNHRILRFDPESKASVVLTQVPFDPKFINVSKDERFLYLAQQEDPKQRVVLLHGLK